MKINAQKINLHQIYTKKKIPTLAMRVGINFYLNVP